MKKEWQLVIHDTLAVVENARFGLARAHVELAAAQHNYLETLDLLARLRRFTPGASEPPPALPLPAIVPALLPPTLPA